MPQSALEQLAGTDQPSSQNQAVQPNQPAQPYQSALESLAGPQPTSSGVSALESLANTPDPAEQGITRNPDGSWVITPKDGESFADTMKRAAAMGSTVTPEQITAQARKGMKLAPAVLAAVPAIGVGQLAALSGAAELPAATMSTVAAVTKMAAEYPAAAAIVKKALVGLAGAEAYKHGKWLLDLLP